MKRRQALQSLIYTAAAIAAASTPYGISRLLSPASATNYSNHLRPPGAMLDDNEFVAACIGCGLCGEICPPKCIQFDKRRGANEVNTPFIDPEVKGCILCGKCMPVCPTEALTMTDRKDVKMGIAQIDRLACYPWVDRGVCGACVAICPIGAKAIVFKFANMYQPVIVEEGCAGCGMCVEICPHPSLPIAIVEPKMGSVMSHQV